MTHRADASAALFRAALAALLLVLILLFHERIERVFALNPPMSGESGDAGVIAPLELFAQPPPEDAHEPESGTESASAPLPLSVMRMDAEPGHEPEAVLEETMNAASENGSSGPVDEQMADPITEVVQAESRFAGSSDVDQNAETPPTMDSNLSDAPEPTVAALAEGPLIPPPISDSGRHWLCADGFMPLAEANELFDAAREAGYVGSILYRVVEGPFSARANMTGDEQDSIVVGEAGRWWRQFGLFAHKENAERLAVQLTQLGYDVVLQGQPEFGPYAHVSDAEAGLVILRQIVNNPFLAARIVAR